MTDEELVQMAKEAFLPHEYETGLPLYIPQLRRFAEMAAAAERERIIAANAPEIEKINEYIKTLEDAVAAEREECAQVCETFYNHEAKDCAEAIRARSNP